MPRDRENQFLPGKLWSLLEMLKRFGGDEFFGALDTLAKFSQSMVEHPTSEVLRVPAVDRDEYIRAATVILDQCTDWRMPATVAVARDTIDWFESIPIKTLNTEQEGVISVVEFSSSQRINRIHSLTQIGPRLEAEASGHLFFYVGLEDKELFEQQEYLFGPTVESNFRSANFDIEEAGRCLALNRWTAAVLHLMRALEPALGALQAEVRVAVQKDQWHHVIDQIEKSIRSMTPPGRTREDIQFFSEAATEFRHIKDAWRNYAAHGKDRYDEERARRIYSSVRSFMMHLSSRLKE